MTQYIGPIVEILLRRVRQEGGLAVAVNFATEVYSRCEQITNAAAKKVLVENASLTVPKEKLLFNFRDEFSDCCEIISISKSNRDIYECKKLEDFSAFEKEWFRNITGTRFDAWAQIGRDLLILYPGQASASSVSVTYVKLLTLYNDFALYYDTASSLPDELIDVSLDLAEIVLFSRFKQLPFIEGKVKELVKNFQLRGIKINDKS